ncbi:hypothetical protein MUTS8_31280 [Escherichia coli]|nr:hypothetical protein ECDEC14C_0728 [Escherichia coli DEC14C]ENA22196.1 hypothetical protein ECP02989421_1158 [Escherichia coli P0298942.1]BDY69767.1 hypothetical protein MUTS8_31280 [Escherichia coli]BDZ01964.1 hypothetical protein MUTS16_30370 [Escherichia coli]
MCSRDKGCAKSRGERQALHDTSGKNGIHGLNYDIRDGIKKVPYYSKCTTGRHLTFRVTLLTSFTEIDTSDACFTLLRGGNK